MGSAFGVLSLVCVWGRIMLCRQCPERPEELHSLQPMCAGVVLEPFPKSESAFLLVWQAETLP